MLCDCPVACKVHAQTPTAGEARPRRAAAAAKCLPAGNGYLRARLSGALSTELNWGNDGTECTGAVRPTDGGIRMRFSRADGQGKLVLVFGIAQLPEGKAARNLPVNVTLIREGAGEFFSTQGDDKCTLDAVTQDVIVGIPRRSRSYRSRRAASARSRRARCAAKARCCCRASTIRGASTSRARIRRQTTY